jgi:hypothetical protein
MLGFLKDHPFAVEAYFESSIVLTFAVHKEELLPFIPSCLTLDIFQEKWSFIAIAMVKTRDLRPKGFPKFMGNDFFLIGYRIFVRYQNLEGKSLRGLYIIKSETDKNKMEIFGNIFTHYNYTTTDITEYSENNINTVLSKKSKFQLDFESKEIEPSLPKDSPFSSWKEARQFAGPLPNTFSVNEEKNEILIIEGLRKNWQPKPLKVLNHSFDFLASLNLKSTVLANAFIIEHIPYEWKKGRKENVIE